MLLLLCGRFAVKLHGSFTKPLVAGSIWTSGFRSGAPTHGLFIMGIDSTKTIITIYSKQKSWMQKNTKFNSGWLLTTICLWYIMISSHPILFLISFLWVPHPWDLKINCRICRQPQTCLPGPSLCRRPWRGHGAAPAQHRWGVNDLGAVAGHWGEHPKPPVVDHHIMVRYGQLKTFDNYCLLCYIYIYICLAFSWSRVILVWWSSCITTHKIIVKGQRVDIRWSNWAQLVTTSCYLCKPPAQVVLTDLYTWRSPSRTDIISTQLSYDTLCSLCLLLKESLCDFVILGYFAPLKSMDIVQPDGPICTKAPCATSNSVP